MYENIYAYHEEIKGKSVWLLFKPNFRESLTLFDGEIRMDGELVLDGTCSKFPDVYVSENAQWLLECEGYAFHLFVTKRANEIVTSSKNY